MAEFVTFRNQFGEGGYTISGILRSYDDKAFVERHHAALDWIRDNLSGKVLYTLDDERFYLTFCDPDAAFEFKMKWC